MNYYNPFASIFTLFLTGTNYQLVGTDAITNWKAYMLYGADVINWVENNDGSYWKLDTNLNNVYFLSPEMETLFILRWS